MAFVTNNRVELAVLENERVEMVVTGDKKTFRVEIWDRATGRHLRDYTPTRPTLERLSRMSDRFRAQEQG